MNQEEVSDIWRPLLSQKENVIFKEVAAALDFWMNGKKFIGINAGQSSPVQFLKSFAAALDNDPALVDVLRAAGVVGDGLPVADDSTTAGEGE